MAEVEFDELPSFIIQKYVDNLVPYGANKYKSDFAPWAWKEVSQGSRGIRHAQRRWPGGFLLQPEAVGQYHLTPPTTWTQFASEAVSLHKDNSKVYLANWTPTDLQWLLTADGPGGRVPVTSTPAAAR